MNELQMFNFKGNEVRTVKINDEPYFVGKDVAKILGYKRSADAIKANVPDRFKGVGELETPGGKQKLTVINEAGLYKLIFKSNMPNAEQFSDWVAEEVLPSIRKNGAYLTDQKAFEITHSENGLADLLMQAGQQLKDKDIQIQEMKPKALFADSVTTSDTTILVGDLAKLMKQNGIDIGANRLFTYMRKNGYLIKRIGADYNTPTQKSMELGLFEIKESTHINSKGMSIITKTPKVTGKGQQYFINKFLQPVA